MVYMHVWIYIYIKKNKNNPFIYNYIYVEKKNNNKKVASICVSVYIIYIYNRYTRFVDNRKNILKKEHFNNYNEKDSIKFTYI